MKTFVPTIYGGATMAALRHNTNINLHENSLLNNAILARTGIVSPSNMYTKVPTVQAVANDGSETHLFRNRYFIIGSGAHVPVTVPGVPAYFDSLPHRPRDSGPYLWLPFKLIQEGQPDITGTERAKYVMRRHITINSINYIGYWIKRMPFDDADVPELATYIVQDGVKQPSATFTPAATDMTPVLPSLTNGQLPNTGRYYEARLPTEIAFTAAEVNDLREVASILFNDPDAVVISEVGMVYGVERTSFNYFINPSDASATGTAAGEVELAGAHVGAWMSEKKQLTQDSDLTIDLNIGATEPEFETV